MVLKAERALESPGGLLTLQIAGPRLQSFKLFKSGVGPKNPHF